jgi:hypothetical protein
MRATEKVAERNPRKRAKNPLPLIDLLEILDYQQGFSSMPKLHRKFIDPFEQLPQHPAAMFIKPTMPMSAVAALKRVAWHFILARREF